MADIKLRRARADEADLLGELALRSKGYWGYDQAFLDACRAELTIRAEDMWARHIVVAESADQVLGFYSVDGQPPVGELGNLWVEPGWIGTGLGRRLWEDAIEAARTAGFTALRIGADPGAEGFYRAMGAERIGETPSDSIPGRMLPLLQVQVVGGGSMQSSPATLETSPGSTGLSRASLCSRKSAHRMCAREPPGQSEIWEAWVR